MDFIRLSTCSMIFMFNLAIKCMRVCHKKLMSLHREKLGHDSLRVLGHLSFRYVKRLLKTY